jgi:hypothetical protein
LKTYSESGSILHSLTCYPKSHTRGEREREREGEREKERERERKAGYCLSFVKTKSFEKLNKDIKRHIDH